MDTFYYIKFVHQIISIIHNLHRSSLEQVMIGKFLFFNEKWTKKYWSFIFLNIATGKFIDQYYHLLYLLI